MGGATVSEGYKDRLKKRAEEDHARRLKTAEHALDLQKVFGKFILNCVVGLLPEHAEPYFMAMPCFRSPEWHDDEHRYGHAEFCPGDKKQLAYLVDLEFTGDEGELADTLAALDEAFGCNMKGPFPTWTSSSSPFTTTPRSIYHGKGHVYTSSHGYAHHRVTHKGKTALVVIVQLQTNILYPVEELGCHIEETETIKKERKLVCPRS